MSKRASTHPLIHSSTHPLIHSSTHSLIHSFTHPLCMHPILFHLGTVAIRSYGAMILVGFVLGLWFGMAAARRLMAGRDPNAPGVITPRHVFDASRVGLFVGLLGTRVLYVVFNWQ